MNKTEMITLMAEVEKRLLVDGNPHDGDDWLI